MLTEPYAKKIDGLNILKQIDGILFEAEENMLINFSEEELHQFNELLDKF